MTFNHRKRVIGSTTVALHQPDQQVPIRKIGDGQEFPIVRITWSRASLRDRLAQLGWTVKYADCSDMLIGCVARS
jgi:hypothetical protein